MQKSFTTNFKSDYHENTNKNIDIISDRPVFPVFAKLGIRTGFRSAKHS